MKYLLFIISSFYILNVCGQTLKKDIVFEDHFDHATSKWERTPIDSGYETYVSDQGRYFCRLPITNSKDWRWTWVNLPTELTEAINKNDEVDFEFNWEVIENKENFRIGLMFDTYNVTDQCPGGDFRAIYVTGDGKDIFTEFMQTKRCNEGKKWTISGTNANYQKINKFRLTKTGVAYNIYINNTNVLSFTFKGTLNMDNLNFGKGIYAFDDMVVTKKTIYLDRPAQIVDAPQATPKIYILLAGTKNYLFQDSLKYTDADINSMYQFWTSMNGGRIPQNQIALITDKTATTENILAAASTLFNKATSKDIIISFLSGHGSAGVFATYNGLIKYETINEIMTNSKAGKKICIVDACHAGSFDPKNTLRDQGETYTEKKALELFYSELQKSGSGIGYFLACKADENSIEAPSLKHGVFTYYLLKGLGGSAQIGNNKLITVEEIYDFVKNAVPKYEPNQHPIMKGPYDPKMPLAIISN